MKWEYRVVQLELSAFRPSKIAEKAGQELNLLGAAGWEAVAAWNEALFWVVLMKRGVSK
jgi:hypothetical protein